MPVAKVAISIDETLLKDLDGLVRRRIFQSRSEAFQRAVEEKLARLRKSRLARECAKLSPREEAAAAEFGFEADAMEWPKY
jgi:metal-responsive CopG/Arc/MetJ family transcriptional regulator